MRITNNNEIDCPHCDKEGTTVPGHFNVVEETDADENEIFQFLVCPGCNTFLSVIRVFPYIHNPPSATDMINEQKEIAKKLTNKHRNNTNDKTNKTLKTEKTKKTKNS